MNQPLTLDQALERCDTSTLPNRVVSSIQMHLKELVQKSSGDIWQILCKELIARNAKGDKELLTYREEILQKLAAVLLKNQNGEAKKGTKNDGMIWKERIAWCQNQNDFLRMFQLLGISDDKWKGSFYIQKTYSGLAQAIVKRFGDWDKFLEFMKIPQTLHYTERIKICTKPEHFKIWFREVGILNDEWVNGRWLHKNYQGVYAAITRSRRWASWADFLQFMSIEKEKTWYQKFSACRTRKDFLKMFERENIPLESLQSSHLLLRASPGAHQGVYDDERFKGWDKFRAFMKIKKRETWAEIIAACKTPADFLRLFQDRKIENEHWKSAKWLQKSIHKSIYDGISADDRFDSWEDFLKFMGHEKSNQWTTLVSDCNKRGDFLSLFNQLSLSQVWRSSKAIQRAGYGGLKAAISKRFQGSWTIFIACMDARLPFEGISSERQAKELLRQEILRLRSTGTWITKSYAGEISEVEWAEIRKPEYMQNNSVVYVVANFLRGEKAD